MNKNGSKVKVDIAVLQEQMAEFKTDVREQFDEVKGQIRDVFNDHVKPVENSVNDLKIKMAYYAGGLAALIVVLEVIIKLWPH